MTDGRCHVRSNVHFFGYCYLYGRRLVVFFAGKAGLAGVSRWTLTRSTRHPSAFRLGGEEPWIVFQRRGTRMSSHDKAKWLEMKGVWMRCYAQCREKALLRQKQMCCWARTFALCAAICLVNLVLQVEFGEPIRISSVRPRTGHQPAAASHLQSPQCQPSPSTSTSISNRLPRK